MTTRAPTRVRLDVFDPEFARLIEPDARLHHLAAGCRWAEGPVYLAASRSLLWSDVRNDRRLCFDEATGVVTVIAQPAEFCNGHTLDANGDVLACEHGSRSVVRLSADGKRTTIADRFEGRRLNSPNDVVVARDGAIWFTDPTYGIDSDAEGHAAVGEIGASNVYRVDATNAEVTAQITDMVRPNGLAFSLDGSCLYVADTGVSHVEDGPRHIRRYDIVDGAVGGGGEVFAVCPDGVFDGFRVDADGRLWCSGRQGVHCYRPDGTLIGTVHLPEVCANLVFGGRDGRTLYMTATTSLYRLDVLVGGAPVPIGSDERT